MIQLVFSFWAFFNESLWWDRISDRIIFLKCRGSLKIIKHLFKYHLLQVANRRFCDDANVLCLCCPVQVPGLLGGDGILKTRLMWLRNWIAHVFQFNEFENWKLQMTVAPVWNSWDLLCPYWCSQLGRAVGNAQNLLSHSIQTYVQIPEIQHRKWEAHGRVWGWPGGVSEEGLILYEWETERQLVKAMAVVLGLEGWVRLLTWGVGTQGPESKGPTRRGEHRVSIGDVDIIIIIIIICEVLPMRHSNWGQRGQAHSDRAKLWTGDSRARGTEGSWWKRGDHW